MRLPASYCCVVALLVLATPAWTGATPAAADERAQLAAQRRQIEARAEQARAACAGRFDVVGCQDAVRRERSAALAPLQRREVELADLERKERADAQQLRVRDKQRDAALRDAHQQMTPAVAAAPAASVPPVRPTSRAGGRDAEAAELARQHQAAQRAAERADSQRLRSQQQRQQIEQRQAEKAHDAGKSGKTADEGKPPAASLPLPSASALAALRASSPASSAPRP